MAIIGHITPRIEQEMGLNENGYKLVYKDEIMSISNEPIQTETIYQKSIKNYSLKPKFQDDKYKILEDFCYLSDYQICDRSVIYVGLKDDAIQIYIESDKTKFPIYVHKNVKIRDIKYSIRRRIHSNFHEVKLIYRGEILDDDKSIDEYQICDQSVINIVEQYNLYFNINNKKIKTKFQKSDKIIDIKYKIQDKIGLHPDEQILIYQGEILDDDKSIDEYQICDRSVIDVALKDDTIQIYIESDKTKFPIYVHKNVKIRDIKYSIRRRIHSNFYEVKLIYQGEILDDFKRIDHYKICEKSVINIVEPFDVHFNINNKKIIKEIHKSDKIIDIKYKIQDKIGLHRDLQQLVYQNEILDDDDKMIGQYGIIRENSTIDVLIKEGINVFVKRINGNANEFTILETQKIKDIMKAMNIKEQILIYQDKILEKEKTFAEYGISNKSIIWAVECRQEMQIIVILIEQLTIVFHVEKASNIHQLRNEIVQKIGKNLDKYDLQYKDIILNENSQDLMKYDSDESVMFIKALPRMKIFVKTKYGRTILLKLKHHSTVMDIKYNVQEQIGLDRTDQKLVYLDKILDDDDKSIIDYKICENSVLQISDMNEIQIIIATIDGKTFSLQMRKTEKIIDLKNKILGKIGLRLNEQTLTYQGELLKDEKSLNDYQINDGSLITIVIPINGGVNVSIKIHDTFAFDIGVQGNEMISEVKRRIGLEIDLSSDDLKLICQNLILDDNNTLENYQFINGSELIINVQMRDEINIIFTTMDGSRFLLKYLKQSYIISDLKLRIQERIKIHPDMQKLIYNTNVLNDDDTSIGDYQILDYSIINIEIENKILCGMNDKMSDIRKKIENQIQLDSQHKVLIFDRKVLEDDNLFIYFQIKSRQEVIIDENFKKFMNAIKFNQLDDVKNHFVNDYLRVKYGSYLNYPIHYACKFASKEIINFLIENTCDLEITELENRTPLHLACIYGNIEAIQTLIDHNCNINAIDYLNRRPIHLACENNHKDVVEILIKNKCEIEIYDYRNRFPLDIAKESKLDDIINIIYIRKVADGMRLSCIDGCNHKFCFKSIFWNQFKGKLIYGGVHDKIYSCGESITDSNKKFAYKKIDKERMSKYIEGKINDFIEILRNVRIIEYFGGYEMKRNKFVFMEYIETGSLRQQIGKPTLLLMKTIKQLLEALEFLHRKEIIHRDIKPDNILLDVLGNIKLIDFEFSCELSLVKEETLLKERFYGTLHYMAPEIMNDEMYSCSVDIWSLGITVIEMATGKIPYHSLKQCEFIDRIIKTREIIYELPNSSSDSGNLKLLIDQMLISDGSKRVGAHELIISFDAYFPNLHE